MVKQTVVLRRRKMPSGNVSLYLDIYHRGVRSYEYLHLYLLPEHGRKDREANRQTLTLAEAICAKRLVEVRNGEYGFHQKASVPFLAYASRLAESKHGSTRRKYEALLRLLNKYERHATMPVSEITGAWYTGFVAYVGRQGLANNTQTVYVAALRHCIKSAYRDGLLASDPTVGLRGVPSEDTNRTYLTIDEVRRLWAAPCANDVVKRAFLFGCLTGIRHCDIAALTWRDVHRQGEYTRIIFRQAKTRNQEYLDINEQAVTLMGERGKADEAVFGLPPKGAIGSCLSRWVATAGIEKHVTFHASRHTFAVMMLELGTDIYTVSKLLGHRSISTTQIYAKVLDKSKQAAVSSIPDLLSD
jgi:site-specific recombinase XerD